VSGSLILSYLVEKKSIKLRIETIIINRTVEIAVIFSNVKMLFLLIYGQYNITGKMNPIIGFIVLPTKVIAEPMSGTNNAIIQFKLISKNVITKFNDLLIPLSLKNNSSIESLLGIIAMGMLAITEKSNAK
jgi:hypothetical protein